MTHPSSQIRARDELGQFLPDDPSTPDVDEAWMEAGVKRLWVAPQVQLEAKAVMVQAGLSRPRLLMR